MDDHAGMTAGRAQTPSLWAADFVARAARSDLRVAVIGLGYVGLPLCEALIGVGFAVRGFDVDRDKVRNLNQGRSYLAHMSDARIQSMVDSGRFEASNHAEVMADADAYIISVPTPVNDKREPDLSYVERAGRAIAPLLRPGRLVVLESTTFPGTTEEVLRPLLEIGGLKAGRDFALGYSPEREDPGNKSYSTTEIPRIISADSPHELACVQALYSRVTHTVPVSNLKTAEAAKLTENIFRFVNIALANELSHTFAAMGVDVWEVMDAAASKPFGFMPFYPGPGVGGHCIPVDPFYLAWKARTIGVTLNMVEAAGDIIHARPAAVVDAAALALDERQAKAMNGAHVLVVGAAYKRDIDDVRDSPALEIMELLRGRGAVVGYIDPFVPQVRLPSGVLHAQAMDETLAAWDCAIIVTDHSALDYEALAATVPIVIDTRNAASHLGRENVIRA